MTESRELPPAEAEWVVTNACLSPKLGEGWRDLYWHGPDALFGSTSVRCSSVWSPLSGETARFPSIAAAEAALQAVFGDVRPNGARVELLWHAVTLDEAS